MRRNEEESGLAQPVTIVHPADALAEGFEVEVIGKGCRGVNLTAGDAERALEELRAAGAVIV